MWGCFPSELFHSKSRLVSALQKQSLCIGQLGTHPRARGDYAFQVAFLPLKCFPYNWKQIFFVTRWNSFVQKTKANSIYYLLLSLKPLAFLEINCLVKPPQARVKGRTFPSAPAGLFSQVDCDKTLGTPGSQVQGFPGYSQHWKTSSLCGSWESTSWPLDTSRDSSGHTLLLITFIF